LSNPECSLITEIKGGEEGENEALRGKALPILILRTWMGSLVFFEGLSLERGKGRDGEVQLHGDRLWPGVSGKRDCQPPGDVDATSKATSFSGGGRESKAKCRKKTCVNYAHRRKERGRVKRPTYACVARSLLQGHF